MFEFSQFKLITPSESERLYYYQSKLFSQLTEENLTDTVLQIVILLTLSPVEDFYESIKILKAYYQQNKDIRIWILGSFLSSQWENYKENMFLLEVESVLDKADTNQQKAIIFYLMAFDIFMRSSITEEKEKYVDLLGKSVELSDGFVYNYYKLAKVCKRQKAKELAKKALSNIKDVLSNEECEELKIIDLISYDAFLQEHILGVSLPKFIFVEIESFYNSL
jgi:hypothetical protein